MMKWNDQPFEEILRKMVFPILALIYLAQVYACRGIYGDGVDNLLTVLRKEAVSFTDIARISNHIIVQVPMVLLLKLGVHDLVFLRYAFSAWILFCPLAVWSSALWKLRNDILFWPFLAVFCFGYFNTDMFAIGEYNLCFALAAYCLVVLLRPLPTDFMQRMLLLIAAALLSFHYPSTLFHGTLLFLLVLTKPREEWNSVSRLYISILAFLFFASAVTGLWYVIKPSDAANFEQARDPAVLLGDMKFRSLLLYVPLCAAFYFFEKAWQKAVMVILGVAVLLGVYFDPFRLFGYPHYAMRAYVAMALTVCGVGLWWLDQRFKKRPHMESKKLPLSPSVLSLILLVMLAWFDMEMSLDFSNYVEIFRRTVNNRTGLVTFEMSGIPVADDSWRFYWRWTYPIMSIILRENNQKGVILNPAFYDGFQAFDPHKEIPNLDKYYQ